MILFGPAGWGKTLLAKAKEKALKYIEENSWHFAVAEDDEDNLDASGNPKPKKGSKGERSYELYCELVEEGASRKEIIEAFQSDRMTPAPPHSKSGATTYFYNMKKKYESGN